MIKIVSEKNKGSILLVSLVILSIVLVAGLSMALLAMRQTNLAIKSDKTNVAYQTADGGLEDVMNAILKKMSVTILLVATSSLSIR